MTLIERIEAAMGPSRELDAEIACTLRIGPNLPDWALNWRGEWTPTIQGSAVLRHDDGSPGPHFVAPTYTASVDDALSLVGGRLVSMEMYDDSGLHPAHVRASAWVQGAPRRFAATPALAICATALRARSSTHDPA